MDDDWIREPPHLKVHLGRKGPSRLPAKYLLRDTQGGGVLGKKMESKKLRGVDTAGCRADECEVVSHIALTLESLCIQSLSFNRGC